KKVLSRSKHGVNLAPDSGTELSRSEPSARRAQPCPALDTGRTIIEIKQIDPITLARAHLDVLLIGHVEIDIAIAQFRHRLTNLEIVEARDALGEKVRPLVTIKYPEALCLRGSYQTNAQRQRHHHYRRKWSHHRFLAAPVGALSCQN